MNGSLVDRFERKISYLRLSVTDRCDLRCTYCLPKGYKNFEQPSCWLTFDEIERITTLFARRGVNRLRITGGEPLLRARLPQLAQRLAIIPGIEDISLSTNATQLERHAAALKEAGVSRINVSLDSLVADKIQRITGSNVAEKIMRGIKAGKQAGFNPIKINMVIVQGVNDGEIDDMVAFCMDHGFILRLIEPMPIGDTGRSLNVFDLQNTRQRLTQRFGLVPAIIAGGGPAHYLQNASGDFSIGFITPMSQHFCATCNRVRLSVDGLLHLCLGQEEYLDLRSLIRDGASDVELDAAIVAAVDRKPERHEFIEAPQKILRFMSATGG